MNQCPTLDILYNEGACLAVNKPSGVLTQAPSHIDSMEARVRSYWQTTEHKSHHLYVGVPHRLDRPASGVLLFARNIRATQRLSAQFQNRTIEKSYLVAVAAADLTGSGTWIDYLYKLPDKPRVITVASDDPRGRMAELHYCILASGQGVALASVQLLTGRTHQIRVQFASRGYPILGDEMYGSTTLFGPTVADPREQSIALHAHRLRFRHPTRPYSVSVSAPPPDAWRQLPIFRDDFV